MFDSNSNKSSQSIFTQKRTKFASNIRKEFLHQIFDQQRSAFKQENQKVFERQLNNEKVTQYLNQYELNPCANTIENLYSMFLVQNCDIDSLIKKNCLKLTLIFLRFPDNIQCGLICRNTIHRGYCQIFENDQQKYKILTESKQNNESNLLQVLDSQKIILFLYEFADKKINQYVELSKQIEHYTQNNPKNKQTLLKQQVNLKNLLRVYIQCLKEIACHKNTFVLHSKLCEKYFQKWLKIFLLQNTELFFYGFLILGDYITLEQYLPFKTFRKKRYIQNNAQQLQLQQMTIFDRFFKLSVPQNFTSKAQQSLVYSTIFIYNIFQNDNLSINVLLKYHQKIFHLTKLIFNHPSSYTTKVKNRAIQFLIIFIMRINKQVQNSQEVQFKQQLMKYDLLQSFKNVDFISLFKLCLMTETLRTKLYIYQILLNLVDYIILTQRGLKELIDQDLLYYIVIGSSQSKVAQASKICLKMISLISIYANKNHELIYKSKMIEFGVQMYLQNLAYHKDPYVSTLAQQLLKQDFSQQERYKCTALQNELKRFESEEDNFYYGVQNRRQMYQ